MFKSSTLLNAFLALFAVALMFFVIVIKSSNATQEKQNAELSYKLDKAQARQGALEAELARLQTRAHILALARAHFGDSLAEVVQELHLADLPDRQINPGSGQRAALTLFAHALKDLEEQQDRDLQPLTDPQVPDLITTLITEDLSAQKQGSTQDISQENPQDSPQGANN